MPAGDLIEANWQAELAGVLMGVGTAFEFGELGIEGLGVPPAKTADVNLVGQDGAYASPDFMGVRTLLVHLVITANSADPGVDPPDEAFRNLADLSAAWEPTATDQEFHLQLPGWGHVKFVGRARGLDAIATNVKSGQIDLIGDFRALSPRMVTV